MAALWPLSRIPAYGVGAKAIFYNAGTTTPQTTYAESGLSTVSEVDGDGYVVADANGFPAVYFNPTPGSYRQRVLNAAGEVLFDDDGISVPQAADFVPPDAGSTDPTLLLATGDIVWTYGIGAISGRVRASGRTIGSASSGATERSNGDCQALFLFLWTQDANLAVSGGGRGGSAASDWAANKTIALPDLRDRVAIGLGDMGNADANRIADALTSDHNTTLGATAGASTHTLSASELPVVTPTFTGAALAATTFNITKGWSHGANGAFGSRGTWSDGDVLDTSSPLSVATDSKSPGTPAGTVSSFGSGAAHTSLQPGMFMTAYVKL